MSFMSFQARSIAHEARVQNEAVRSLMRKSQSTSSQILDSVVPIVIDGINERDYQLIANAMEPVIKWINAMIQDTKATASG